MQNPLPWSVGLVCSFHCFFRLFCYSLSLELLLLASVFVWFGVIDDRYDIPALPRLGLKVLLALVLTAWSGVELFELGDLSFVGNIELGVQALPLTVIAVVGVMNAVNFSDGIDGLAGGMVLGLLVIC